MDSINKPLQLTISPPTADIKPAGTFWQNDGPSFKDILDTLNPLQHIPLVSSLYQSMTGDTLSTGAKMAGDTLYGGALGLLSSIINSIVETQTGTDIGGNILSAITGEPTPSPKTTATLTEPAPPADFFISASKRSAYNAYVSVQSA